MVNLYSLSGVFIVITEPSFKLWFPITISSVNVPENSTLSVPYGTFKAYEKTFGENSGIRIPDDG